MSELFAEVVIERAALRLERSFTYRVPERLRSAAEIGSRVLVPLGREKTEPCGIIINLLPHCDLPTERVRELSAVLTDQETVDSGLVRLAAWMSRRYGSPMAKALRTVFPTKRKISAARERTGLLPLPEKETRPPDPLTPKQERALLDLLAEWEGRNRPCLLYGATGSGKTLLYMELIGRVLSEGRQAIVLIPEIALTYQTAARFAERFGKEVSFLHSRMSEGERYERFKAAKSGEIRIMVGPRSALFTPFPDLGLIVMDEEHEGSYHSESAPRYHARETASERARQSGAHFVMGSATPSLEAYYRCETGAYALIRLAERYHAEAGTPKLSLVDMRGELKSGNRSPLSRCLLEELAGCLQKGRQAMLFLNRRGYAGFVQCRNCGHVLKCPHCDIALTEHRGADRRMVCHYCGYSASLPECCPACGSRFVGGVKLGTEQLEEKIRREFPAARILRMDRDTTKGKEGHAKILEAFAAGEADILIGTQMIVKGHDFQNVTLVGVVLADLSLNASDFRAAERTFSLIAQAVGRCGRGAERGTAVIQTYQADNPLLRWAAEQDYETFYREEIRFRRLMGNPPCGEMGAVLGSAADEVALSEGMRSIRYFLKRIDERGLLTVIGPAPQKISRVKDRFRQAIYIRTRDAVTLTAVWERLSAYFAVNRGFRQLTMEFDRDMWE